MSEWNARVNERLTRARERRVEIIANDMGNRTTPSYVAFTDSERLIGDSAKNQVRARVASRRVESR